MKVVGLFRELNRGCNASLQTIHSAIRSLSDENAEIISKYLRSGVPVIDIMEASIDPFDRAVVMPGGASLISDGDWVWREDLAYFVEKYKVGLPEAFMFHALKKKVVTADSDSIVTQSAAVRRAYEAGMKGN